MVSKNTKMLYAIDDASDDDLTHLTEVAWVKNIEYFLGCSRAAMTSIPLRSIIEEQFKLVVFDCWVHKCGFTSEDEFLSSEELACKIKFDISLFVAPNKNNVGDYLCWSNVRESDDPDISLRIINKPVTGEEVQSDDGVGFVPRQQTVYMCSVPLYAVMAPYEWENTYTVYVHHFISKIEKEFRRTYVGITKQGWPARWKQHLNAAKNGSMYLFHQAIRECQPDNFYTYHKVIAAGLSYEDAMNLEEQVVAERSLNALHPHGLNMIPGGFAGIRFLGQRGFTVTPKQWENRGALVRDFNRYCERAGKPNLALSMKWTSDDFAAKMILSNPNNLNRDQLTRIRTLGEFGMSAREIADNMEIRDQRVNAVLTGKTYSRVK